MTALDDGHCQKAERQQSDFRQPGGGCSGQKGERQRTATVSGRSMTCSWASRATRSLPARRRRGFLGIGETKSFIPLGALMGSLEAVHIDQSRGHVAGAPRHDPDLTFDDRA